MINRIESNTGKRGRTLHFLCICMILAAVLFLILFKSNEKTIIGFEVTILFVWSVFIIFIIKNNSYNMFTDIRFYSLISYWIYNSYLPIVYMFSSNALVYYGSNVGWYYSIEDLEKSLFISIIFLISFTLPFIKRINIRILDDISVNDNFRDNFYHWTVIFLIALLWYTLPYFKLGWANALSYGRWERYEIFESIKNEFGILGKFANLFLSGQLTIVSSFMMFRNAMFQSKKRKKYILGILLVLETIFYLFIDFRRRELMYIFLMCGAYYMIVRHIEFNFKKAKIYIILTMFTACIFTVYSSYRNYFPIMFERGIKYAINIKQYSEIETTYEDKWYFNEFGLVYINNLSSVKFAPEPFYGKTYIESIVVPIPIINKSLQEYFGYEEEVTSLTDEWQSGIFTEIFSGGGGLGFSPASEAYLNLGYYGCILFGFMIGLFFRSLYGKLYTSKNFIFYILILPQGWNFSRITFTGVTHEVFWFAFYYIFYSWIISVISGDRYAEKRIANKSI